MNAAGVLPHACAGDGERALLAESETRRLGESRGGGESWVVSLITCGGTPAVNPQLHTCSSVYTLLCVHFVCLLYSQSMRIDTIPDTHISQRMHGGTSYRTDNVRCANNNEISFHDATQNTERHRT